MTTATVAYDPHDPGVVADPYPTFRRLRERDPVHWSPALSAWVLTRYADVRVALFDARLSADRISPFRDHLAPDARGRIAELLRGLGFWLVFNDPPAHTRRRALLLKAFSPAAIEALRPMVQRLADRLLDDVAGSGRMDVIRDLAYPLPAIVIARLVGVPEADINDIKRWSDELATFVGSAGVSDKRDRAERAMVEAIDYHRRMVAEHRARPRDDLMSELLAAEQDGAPIAEDEVIHMCIALVFAGHETTTNLIANGVLSLLRHPGELDRLRADPALMPGAVEEILRYEGPVQALTRIALEDVPMGDRVIRRGDRVIPVLNAANRDPAQFAAPDRFDISRADNRHVTFGHGIHFCAGAPLARLEGQVALATLLARLRHIELLTPEPRWKQSLVLRGPEALEIGFTEG